MLSCKEVSLLMSRACDGRLTWRERIGVRLHLLYCQGCRRFRDQLRYLRAAAQWLAQQAQADTDTRLPAGARQRIRDALRQH
jgi:Putative zinc-finger